MIQRANLCQGRITCPTALLYVYCQIQLLLCSTVLIRPVVNESTPKASGSLPAPDQDMLQLLWRVNCAQISACKAGSW